MNFLCFVQNQTDTSHFLKLKYSLLVPQNGPCQYRSVSDITSGRFIIRSELWKLPVASAINSAAYRVIVSTSGAITGTLSGHPHSKVHCWKSDSSTLISVFDSVLSIANVTELNRNYTESFQANNYLSEVDHCIKKNLKLNFELWLQLSWDVLSNENKKIIFYLLSMDKLPREDTMVKRWPSLFCLQHVP